MTIEIPTEFSLKEQLEELQVTYLSRRDFIEKRIASGKAVAPSKELAYYSLARLKAAGETLRMLYEQRGASAAPVKEIEQAPAPPPAEEPETASNEPSGPPPGMDWDD